mmetsp:Transcript_21289/g.49339  ORF Transcript_21289/g.49339 Transcript_21289/m.49339 type:complete len:226 (+) Transcript_21289:77-754(+)
MAMSFSNSSTTSLTDVCCALVSILVSSSTESFARNATLFSVASACEDSASLLKSVPLTSPSFTACAAGQSCVPRGFSTPSSSCNPPIKGESCCSLSSEDANTFVLLAGFPCRHASSSSLSPPTKERGVPESTAPLPVGLPAPSWGSTIAKASEGKVGSGPGGSGASGCPSQMTSPVSASSTVTVPSTLCRSCLRCLFIRRHRKTFGLPGTSSRSLSICLRILGSD